VALPPRGGGFGEKAHLRGGIKMDTLLLSKLLPTLVWPLGLGCFLLVASLAAYRWRRVQALLIAAALGLIWVPSTRCVAGKLLKPLEWKYPGTNDLPSVDAIVVLGGSARPALPPRTGVELGESGDRLLRAAETVLPLPEVPLRLLQHSIAPMARLEPTLCPWHDCNSFSREARGA